MYPEAKMIPAMKIWKLPKNKEGMFSDICKNGEYFASEKIDGHWAQFEKTEHYSYLFSRSISKITGCLGENSANVPHIINAFSCLPANTILIGEVFFPNKTAKDAAAIMGCLPKEAIKRQKDNPIHFYVHDIIEYNNFNLISESAERRYKILATLWQEYQLSSFDFLHLADCFDTNIEEHLAEIFARGGEGIVLKKKDCPYYPDKRPAWSTIKIKQQDTIDLICTGFCDATKEYTGKEISTWEYWENNSTHEQVNECMCGQDGWSPITKGYFYKWKTAMKIGAFDDNGKLIELGTVSSGLTDIDREKMSTVPEEYLNQVFEFSCMSLDKKEHTLRHPRIIGKRIDKNAEECKIKDIF